MCKYCERIVKKDKLSAYGQMQKEEISVKVDNRSHENLEAFGCIIDPTPISRRQHQKDGLTSTLEIMVDDSDSSHTHLYIQIKYCPFCGKELS